MRRVALILTCLVAFTMAGASAVEAGHHHGHGHGRGHGHGGWGGPHGGYYRGGHHGHHGHRGPAWCGTRPYYGNYGPAYGAYPVYPQTGFGVALPNFSFFYAR